MALRAGINAAASAITVAEATTTTTVTSADWAPVLDAMTGQISVGSLVGVIAAVVAAGIGLVFMWWGIRKAAKSLMAAFKSGKLKF